MWKLESKYLCQNASYFSTWSTREDSALTADLYKTLHLTLIHLECSIALEAIKIAFRWHFQNIFRGFCACFVFHSGINIWNSKYTQQNKAVYLWFCLSWKILSFELEDSWNYLSGAVRFGTSEFTYIFQPHSYFSCLKSCSYCFLFLAIVFLGILCSISGH